MILMRFGCHVLHVSQFDGPMKHHLIYNISTWEPVLGGRTDTALDMLVKQIHAAWQADNGVASVLSIDMTRAFDRVKPVLLFINLMERCIPQWWGRVVQW